MLLFVLLLLPTGCNTQNSPNVIQKPKTTRQLPIPDKTNLNTALPSPETTDNTKQWKTIASYSTIFNPNDSARATNIKLTTAKISGYILEPGEVFSFNEVVGEASAENGYKKAPIVLYGEKAIDYGGGVCQVSSTLYNAAEEANLEILERNSHSKEVDYVPEGKDATIAYGTLDFKFKNTTSTPIMINVYTEGNKVIALLANQ